MSPATTFPQINNGKRPNDPFHVRHMLALPPETPFGNLLRKHSRLILEIDIVNLKIESIFKMHERLLDPSGIVNGLTEYEMEIEELVYWLKTIADDLIMTASLLWSRRETGDFPLTIAHQEIGKINRQCQNDRFVAEYSKHFDHLAQLNEIANALKHSVTQSDSSLIGHGEPIVFALPIKYNALKNIKDYVQIPVKDLIIDFDLFFQDAVLIIKKLN